MFCCRFEQTDRQTDRQRSLLLERGCWLVSKLMLEGTERERERGRGESLCSVGREAGIYATTT